MQIIIRLDDITPDMNWSKFSRMREILDKYGVKPLIGVVPECKDGTLHFDEASDKFYDVIRELMAAGWVVAQHGTYHVYETEDSGLLGINPFSEFAGLSYEAQLEKLRTGREILTSHGINTDIFMAPGHTYDDNTVKALSELGFTTITDGLYELPYIYKGIMCVPCRLAEYRNVHGLDTLCMHANIMDDDDFTALEEFLKEHQNDIIPFDVDKLRSQAVEWSETVAKAERKVLAIRQRKDKAANSARISWYLSYTNHSNSKIKWLKRVVMLPLLLTNKYKDGIEN